MSHITDDDVLHAARESTILSELIDVVGLEATLAIVDGWGGRRLYVPIQVDSWEHPLVQAVGSEAARRLSRYYGTEHICVPLGKSLRRMRRDKQILDDAAAGMSQPEIARKHDCTVKTISNALKRYARTARPAERRPVPRGRKSQPLPKQPRDNGSQQLNLF